MDDELLQAIAVTAELTGTDMSKPAAKMFAQDLSAYPLRQVLAALARCRKEVKGRLTVAEVVTRIDDGRPGVEEAWALLPKSEADSGAMTVEMLAGYAVAAPLLDEDPIAARMAFKEAYTAAIQRARDAGAPVKWSASLGHSKAGRHDAEQEAERRQALTDGRAARLLERQDEPLRLAHLEAAFEQAAPANRQAARETLAGLRAMLGGGR